MQQSRNKDVMDMQLPKDLIHYLIQKKEDEEESITCIYVLIGHVTLNQ